MCATESLALLPAPELRLPRGPNYGGFLILDLEGRDGQSVKVVVKLQARMVNLVLILWEVMEAAPDDVWPSRGWCSVETLRQMIDSRTDYFVGARAVRNYVSRIRTQVARAVSEVADKLQNPLPPHLLVEGKRGYGYRLAVQRLKVVLPQTPRSSLSG